MPARSDDDNLLTKSADLAGVSRFQVGDDYLGHLVQTRAQNLVPVLRGLSAPRDFFSEGLKHFVIGSLSKWAILDMRRAPTRRGFLEMPCQPGVIRSSRAQRVSPIRLRYAGRRTPSEQCVQATIVGPSGQRLLDTSSLKPVPSLHQKLVLNQSLTCGTETCSADRSFNNAKLDEPLINFVRQRSVLMPVELQKAAPFLVSEVSPSAHDWCLSVERMDDSMILLFEGTAHSILEWPLDFITSAIIISRLKRVETVAHAITTMKTGHAGQRSPIFRKKH